MFLPYALNSSTIIKKQCRFMICTAFLITLRPEVLPDNQRTHGSTVPVSAAYLPIFFSCPTHTYHRQPGCSEAHRPHRSVTDYWILKEFQPLWPNSISIFHRHHILFHRLLYFPFLSSLARISAIFCSRASIRLSLSALSFFRASISLD